MKKHDVVQRSPEWHFLRKGKITGTTLKSLMGTPKARQEAKFELIAERLSVGVDGDSYENAMDRGTRLEPEAIAMFELQTGKQVTSVGFIEDSENGSMGQSPDGMIGDEEALEVKCPMGKNYVKIWLENKIPDEYHWQIVQLFVLVSELKKVYFVAYNPDIPSHRMHIIEVVREELTEDIAKAREEQLKVISEVNQVLKSIIKPI